MIWLLIAPGPLPPRGLGTILYVRTPVWKLRRTVGRPPCGTCLLCNLAASAVYLVEEIRPAQRHMSTSISYGMRGKKRKREVWLARPRQSSTASIFFRGQYRIIFLRLPCVCVRLLPEGRHGSRKSRPPSPVSIQETPNWKRKKKIRQKARI